MAGVAIKPEPGVELGKKGSKLEKTASQVMDSVVEVIKDPRAIIILTVWTAIPLVLYFICFSCIGWGVETYKVCVHSWVTCEGRMRGTRVCACVQVCTHVCPWPSTMSLLAYTHPPTFRSQMRKVEYLKNKIY